MHYESTSKVKTDAVALFDPRQVKPKALELVFATSPLITQHLGVRARTGRPKVIIVCLGKVAGFPADCCFREMAR